MMRFTLHIDLGNDAMQTPADVADALARLGARFADEHSPFAECEGTCGAIRDANGNTVGRWEVL